MFCHFSLLYVLINVFVVWVGDLLCLLLTLYVGGLFCFDCTGYCLLVGYCMLWLRLFGLC